MPLDLALWHTEEKYQVDSSGLKVAELCSMYVVYLPIPFLIWADQSNVPEGLKGRR